MSAAIAALLVGSAQDAKATDRFWNGAAGANWATGTSWSPSGTPGASDNAWIANGFGPSATTTGNVAAGVYVGAGSGSGTLGISDSGALSAAWSYLGYAAGKSGTATVSGASARWATTNSLYVGYNGTGTLSVSNGALVSDTSALLGYAAGSSGTATVDGVGSRWTSSSNLWIGYAASAGATVRNGATVSTTNLYVGNSADGTLAVSSGGTVTSSVGVIAAAAAATGTVTVDGTGSQWTNSSTLYVGQSGRGTLTIENGGTVGITNATNTWGIIGYNSGSNGTVTVTGANSQWTIVPTLYVGYSGTGNLTIANGGSVSNTGTSAWGIIGYNAGSTGTVTVDGTNSQWTMPFLSVGDSGRGTLTVQNGGKISNSYGYIGNNANSSGTVTVSGSGATWTNSQNLYVGYSGNGTLNIQNGGTVSNVWGLIGYTSTAHGTATVTGANSLWTNSQNLYVGYDGAGTLNVENGGTVQTLLNGVIGYKSGVSVPGSSGTATVTGAGSTWITGHGLWVGNNGSGTGTLVISNGGTVIDPVAVLASEGADSKGQALVTGAGSTWITTTDPVLGYSGTGEFIVGQSGTGTLTVADGGTVSAPITSIATQTGSVGTLNIGAAPGAAPQAPGTLATTAVVFGDPSAGTNGTGTLNFNHTATNYTFAPPISGPGAVGVYAGTTILTGDSSGLTGPTSVHGGTLIVDGSVANSTVTVDAGGTLGGHGTVGSTVINGTLSPGNSIGTITVSGNLTFGSGSTYLVEVSPAAADRTNVTGTAALAAGTVQASFVPGAYVTKQYTILHADGGLGGSSFGGLATFNMPAGFTAALIYDADNAYLDLTGQLVTTGLPVNPQHVADAINGYFNNGGTLPPAFLPVFGLSGAALSTALSQLSGEATTGAQQAGIQLTNQFLTLLLDPCAFGRGAVEGNAGTGDALPFASEQTLPPEVARAFAKVVKAPAVPVPATPPQWTAWGGAFGGTNKTDGDAATGSHNLTASTGGFAAGADYHAAPDTVLGFALAGGFTRWDVAAGFGGGSSDAFLAGIYGVTRPGPWYLAGALSFAEHWMTTERTAFAGDPLEGRFDAQSYGGRVETGWRFATPLGGVTPYTAAQIQWFHMPGFAERDLTGGGFGLTYASRDTNATRSELGARFEHLAAVSDTALLALQARVAWAHDWTSDPTLTPMFQALPGASFVVAGARTPPDLALLSAGAELRLAHGWSLAARFDGELADRTQTYAGTGTLRYRW